MLSTSLLSLSAFLAIGFVYACFAIGRSTERVYTGLCLALLIAIAGLCGYTALTHLEHALALAARV